MDYLKSEALESFEALFERGTRMFRAMAVGVANPTEVAKLWRRIADLENDPVRRAEALINLASALDCLGDDERIQAIAITERALKLIEPKHAQAAGINLMAAQRLLENVDHPAPAEIRQALDYLHAALAAPTTATSREVTIAILVRYATAAPRMADFSRLDKARRIFDRLRKRDMSKDEIGQAFNAMVSLYEARWKVEAHRPSLGQAISLSGACLTLLGPDQCYGGVPLLAAFQQRHGVLLMDRYEHTGVRSDFDMAVGLLREASKNSHSHATILNSLANFLLGSDARPPTDLDFNEARRVLDEGFVATVSPKTHAYLRWTEANWFLQAYWRGGPVGYLDRAVEAVEAAAVQRIYLGDTILFTVAHAYYDRYRVGRDADDIERAIDAAQLGLDLCSVTGADRWRQELTAASMYQERAITNRFGFDTDDADRASELLRSAFARLPRDSEMRAQIAANTLASLMERYIEKGDDRSLKAAAEVARMLPDTPQAARSLPGIAAVNVATFHLHFMKSATDRNGWIGLLRDFAMKNTATEPGWLAAANLMHSNVGKDWAAVVEAFHLMAKQRSSRLAAARTPRERAMVLRREQSNACIAGLAYLHLGAFSEAAQLIDESQAVLLASGGGAISPRGGDHWSSIDAIFYPVITRYGAYVLTANESHSRGAVVRDIEFPLPTEPAVPDHAAMVAASSLVEAAFGNSVPGRLLIIPCGALGSFPWAAVPVGTGTLIDHAQISVLPSRNLWQGQEAGLPPDIALVEAAHAIQGASLRHAEAEIREIRNLVSFGVDLWGTNATRSHVGEALKAARSVHFACHGITEFGDPTQTHLVLHKGESLTVGDLLDLDCSSLSLACLSACRSAVHGSVFPDEFASLAVAFLVAGARAALGTLWNVSDVAASLFSRRFFHTLAKGESIPGAARSAQIWLRESSDDDKVRWLDSLNPACNDAERQLRAQLRSHPGRTSFKDPKYWAAFACYG
ncbi:CHAT domain-containing protein [Neorhizobium galegae]|uniref:CHAT domain-containing protein n=1 Tax=Neorhizobium galegae TaxID=399 RepID=UPI002105E669|nr:CHAT domain-containing protein [Neorhizobium galegae]MCQ1774493.1 CHAT domain-containing protein [Neorhizobium galegae]MCQ1799254.1 CHAT domain-containing protein [Neorhizobium galegae]